MSKGSELSLDEVNKIWSLHHKNFSENAIAKVMKRSRAAVQNAINRREGKFARKRPGGVPKLDARAERRITRQASAGKSSAARIKNDQNAPISTRRVQQILKSKSFLSYEKRMHAPVLTPSHKRDRIVWAKWYANMNEVWARTIFTDEKKFNLDGPDCLQYYWHDLRKEKETYKTRQNGGGGRGEWSRITESDLKCLTESMNERYFQVLLNKGGKISR